MAGLVQYFRNFLTLLKIGESSNLPLWVGSAWPVASDAARISAELALNPRKIYTLIWTSADGGVTADAETEACIQAWVDAGVPRENIYGYYVPSNLLSVRGTVTAITLGAAQIAQGIVIPFLEPFTGLDGDPANSSVWDSYSVLGTGATWHGDNYNAILSNELKQNARLSVAGSSASQKQVVSKSTFVIGTGKTISFKINILSGASISGVYFGLNSTKPNGSSLVYPWANAFFLFFGDFNTTTVTSSLYKSLGGSNTQIGSASTFAKGSQFSFNIELGPTNIRVLRNGVEIWNAAHAIPLTEAYVVMAAERADTVAVGYAVWDDVAITVL